ncbi:hypothetical protein M3J09_004142 [Ascochyta lentis]
MFKILTKHDLQHTHPISHKTVQCKFSLYYTTVTYFLRCLIQIIV